MRVRVARLLAATLGIGWAATALWQANKPLPTWVVYWFSASSLAMFSKMRMNPVRGSR